MNFIIRLRAGLLYDKLEMLWSGSAGREVLNSEWNMAVKSILIPASAMPNSATPLLSSTVLCFIYCPGIRHGSCNRKVML